MERLSGVALKEQGREAGGAVRGGQADHARVSACAVKARIGTAINLGAFDRSSGKRAEIELTAQVAGVNAVEKDLVVVGIAAADKERSLRPHLPGLHDFSSRHEPQSADEIVAQRKIERAEHGCCRAGLRLRRRRAGCRHHDGFAHPGRLEHHVPLDGIELAGVEIGRLQLTKALGRDHEEETALGSGGDLEAAIGRGNRRSNDLAVADKRDACAGDLGARGIGDHATDGSGMTQGGKKDKENGATACRITRQETAGKKSRVGMKAPSFPSERESECVRRRTGLLTCALKPPSQSRTVSVQLQWLKGQIREVRKALAQILLRPHVT